MSTDAFDQLPKALAAYLRTELGSDERLLHAAELNLEATKAPPTSSAPAPQAPLWLLLTTARVLMAAADTQGRTSLRQWARREATVKHQSGLWRDAVVVDDERYELSMGSGKRAAALVAALTEPPSKPELDTPHNTDTEAAQAAAPEPKPEETPTLPQLGSLWFDAPPTPVQNTIAGQLEQGERCLGVLETASSVPLPKDAPLWFVLTESRAALATADKDGERNLWRQLDRGALMSHEHLTRDEFYENQVKLFVGPLMGGGRLRRLFKLATLSPLDALMEAAQDHTAAKRWDEALALWQEAWGQLEGDPRAVLAGLRRAQAQRALKQEALALEALQDTARLDPEDDLMARSTMLGLDDREWTVALAICHDALDHHAAAARVYQALSEADPAQDYYLLQRARNLRGAGQNGESLECYALFIDQRLRGAELVLLDKESQDATAAAGGDPELAEACLESGRLMEETGRHEAAARRYLTLIRHAPYAEEGYARLFALADRVPEEAFAIGQAVRLLRLLNPQTMARIEEGLEAVPTPVEAAVLPVDYTPIDDASHDAELIHPSEQAQAAVAQRWLGQLVSERQDTQDIERHCQRIDDTSHPLLATLVVRVAHLLSLPTPRVYLSHGNTGVQVLGESDAPFLMLGQLHIQEGHGRRLGAAPLAFVVGSQLEHIRAKHLILTSSEFWSAFGNRSLDGLMTVLSLIPTAAWLGKLTDGVALKWLSEVQKRIEGQSMGKVLTLAEEQVKKGALGEGANSVLQTTLEKLKGKQDAVGDSESLLKEQLADFARGALYTADRVGLLACDDLGAAVEAIFKLSSTGFEEWPAVERYGLAHVLARRDADGALVYRELAMRLSELARFALSPQYQTLREAVLPQLAAGAQAQDAGKEAERREAPDNASPSAESVAMQPADAGEAPDDRSPDADAAAMQPADAGEAPDGMV